MMHRARMCSSWYVHVSPFWTIVILSVNDTVCIECVLNFESWAVVLNKIQQVNAWHNMATHDTPAKQKIWRTPVVVLTQ